MNGQPDQPLNQGEPSPAQLGTYGFGGEQTAPGASAWNPEAIPTPGPIPSAPVAEPTPSLQPTPMVSPATPTPSPLIGEALMPTPPAPAPVMPSFSPLQNAEAFTTPSLTPPTPTPAPRPEPIAAPTPTPPAPPAFSQSVSPVVMVPGAASITPRSFEIPSTPAPVPPSSFSSAASTASVPPPPQATSTIDLRTMASDVSSLQATGGAEAVPQTFTPEAFTSTASAVFSPEEVAATKVEKPKGNTGKILLIVGSVVLVFGIGIGAYFLFAGKTAPVTPETPEVVAPPVETEVPPAEILPPSAETPSVEGAAVPETPAAIIEQPSRSHSSLFVISSDAVEQKVVPTASLEEIKKAFYAVPEGASAPADGFMKEVVITKSGAGFINFSEFIGAFLPELSQDSIKALFSEDFTAFVHQDRTNPMMGFIASVKTEAAPEAVTAFSSSFEASKNIGNFYAKDPGNPAATWNGGFVSGKPVQYLAFPKAGYAFDYGWFKDKNGKTYLVVSASYAGMREAVRRAEF